MAHRVKSRLRGPPIFLLLLCAYWTNGEANQLDCQVEELEKSLDRALGGAQQKQQQMDSLNQGLEKLKRKVSLILYFGLVVVSLSPLTEAGENQLRSWEGFELID